MIKDKYIQITTFFHLMLIFVLLVSMDNIVEERKDSFVKSQSEKLLSVVQTLAKANPEGKAKSMAKDFLKGVAIDETDSRYLLTSSEYRDILSANGLNDCELSFIVFNDANSSLYRIVSSDPVYRSGESFKEYDQKFLTNYSIGGAQLSKLNESIWKIEAFRPVVDFSGSHLGILRISSGNIKDRLGEFSSYWNYLLPILIYSLFAIVLTMIIIRKRKRFKLTSTNNTIHEELSQKNSELKMLSLVAKKSENLMLISDERGQILWVNEIYETKNNYTAEELNDFIGKYLQDVSKNEHIRTIIKNVVDFQKAFTYESSSKDDSGGVYYAMTTVSPVLNDENIVTNLLFVDTDVTKVKRAQKENEIYKEFVMKSKLPRIHLTSNGVVRFANPAANPVLDIWRNSKGVLKDDIITMLHGICNSGVTQDMSIQILGIDLKLNFHPNKVNQELFIIGESLTKVKVK